ncbi:MAG: RNHCP domain-containing protein [Phycisphaerae bacterium]
MTITFKCQRCQKEVQAPDAAAGKRGKCPFCGNSVHIPEPVAEGDILPLAPIDQEEERRREEERHRLLRQQKDLLSETGGQQTEPPLEQREDLSPEHLHHFVVNYCLDMAGGKLDRAETYVPQLKKFGVTGRAAVDDFLSGRALEPALDSIPARVLQGFLAELRDKLR